MLMQLFLGGRPAGLCREWCVGILLRGCRSGVRADCSVKRFWPIPEAGDCLGV